MILDLNLSELPQYTHYDSLVVELLEKTYPKNIMLPEVKKAFKVFSKLSINQLFADLSLNIFWDKKRRCRF
jgi:sulfur relay (sulfurtransferase) DsrF/TusC family protein